MSEVETAKRDSFPNYAGVKDIDDALAAELEAAGITVGRYAFLKNGRSEVEPVMAAPAKADPAAVLVEEIATLFAGFMAGNSALSDESEDLDDLRRLIIDRVELAITDIARRARIVRQPIETAPRDGTRFWGIVDGEPIGMLWHPKFEAFVSTWQRTTLRAGLTIDGAGFKDHSPTIHHPTAWIEIPADEIAQKMGEAAHG